MKVESQILKETTEAELTIELSNEEVQPFVDAAAKRISKEVNIQGFRKGKVPFDVLKQHVGEATIYEEAFQSIVEDAYPKAVDQEGLQVAGRANIDLETLVPGNPVVFKARVPLLPNVELGDYKKLKVEAKEPEMDEKKFEDAMLDLQRMRAKEKLVDRAAKDGDKVMMDFDVKVDGKAIEGGSAQNQKIVIGEGKFIPGFEEELVGMKKGEDKTFKLKFPEKYKEDLAGKEAEFTVKIHDVFELELPKLDDEFGKDLAFDSLDQLQEAVRKNIMKELEVDVKRQFELDVIKEIQGKSKVDPIAPQLIQEECEKMLMEMKQDIARQGMSFDDYLQHMKTTEADLLEGFKKPAEERISAALVIRELAKDMDIKIEKKDIDAELDEMLKAYGEMPEARKYLDTPDQRAQIENRLIHDKTFETLKSYTKGAKK